MSLTRRAVLAGGLAAAVTACSGSGSDGDRGSATTTAAPEPEADRATSTTTSSPAAAPAAFTAADFDDLGSCQLTPAQMAGPFPLDQQFDRRDITEGVPGTPLRLGFRVVDDACSPVPGASVEIWHADATGDYSAFIDDGGGKDEGEGTTFLRGTQAAGDDGIVEFASIYPGWYTGRAVHVHVRVHVDGEITVTSQVYFDEALTERVFRNEPYAEFGPPDTSWADDAIAGDPATDGTALALTRTDTGITGLINLGIAV